MYKIHCVFYNSVCVDLLERKEDDCLSSWCCISMQAWWVFSWKAFKTFEEAINNQLDMNKRCRHWCNVNHLYFNDLIWKVCRILVLILNGKNMHGQLFNDLKFTIIANNLTNVRKVLQFKSLRFIAQRHLCCCYKFYLLVKV